MMKADEIKWDKRYQAGSYPTEPHQAVTRYCSLANIGQALDIAAGNGRNSVFLAEKGFAVDAVDLSSSGLQSIPGRYQTIEPIHADLDHYRIKENRYDLIININFLQRRLIPAIKAGLKNDGILIFRTYMDPRLTGGQCDPAKQERFLNANELLHAFLSLRIVVYLEQKESFSNGEQLMAATLVARKEV